MNGSWSDASDRSGELELVNPGSQSEASGEEFESSDEADNDEGEELDRAENSNEQNFIQRQVQSAEEADHNIEVEDDGEALDNSGDTLVSLDEDLAGVDGSKPSHGVINMHHVDMILDNIDAELHNIINRSRTSEASEHSFQSGQTRTQQSLVQEIQTPESLSEESNDDTTADEEEHDDNGFDTGLGTSSLPRDSSLVPRMDHTHQGNGIVQMNGVAKNSRDKKRLSNKRNQRDPHRKPIVELSDVDSICSEDIRIRMEETLNLQDSDTNTLHTHNPSFTHDAPSQYSTPRYSAHSPHHETLRGEQTETTSDQELQVADKEDGDREEITSRIKEIVSMALSESASAGSSSDSTQVLGRYHHQRSKELRNSNVKTASSSAAPTSRSFQEHRRAGRGCDMDSIATEDFEHIFQTSIILPQSSSSNNLRHSPKKHAAAEKPSHPVGTLKSSPPLKDTDRLMVPGHGKRGKSRHRKKRTATVPTSKPSGLPEYMYLRKEVTESDLGSDSIKTEEYEGHFEVAKVIDYHSTPKYAKESKLPKRLRGHNVQSDPESIQTEEYEQRFRSLMVKHVAGVQVKSFDQVSIQSDLESVETGMVHQKFQEALQKGPEVKVFDEYGDRSDTDPMQMEELEQKFQAVLKQKKKDKKRYTQQDTDEGGTSDVDSVRAIPSKSETGSPPNRQGTNGRKQAQRLLNGGRQTHHSRDPSPRSSAYSSSRSSPRVTSTPARPQPSASSPWGTPRDISPSPPQQSPTLQQGVHPQFAFAPQLQGKPCGNHEKAAQRPGQSNHPSWQDPSLGRQRAAAWNAQHQDSFSTYEEVESLHSHQCSSLQSLDNSCSPSRLQSFGSSSSSLDQALQQIEGESPFTSGVHIPIDQESSSCSREDRGSSLESESTNSVSVDGRQPVHLPKNTRKGHLPEKSRRSLIDEDEEEMNASVAKWVDQTRAETARRRSNVGLPKDPQVRSHEAPEGSNKPHDVTKERFLTALNMQCGDVIVGRSGSSVRLPNETDLELALRVGNSSPMNSISRGASIDGASIGSSAGEDHTKPEGGWTLAENVLIDLGFAGSNIGIPDRFLRSWKEQVMKQRIEEVRRLLGNSSGNYLVQHLPPKLGTSTPPTEKLSFVPSSKNLTAGPRTPQSQASAPQPSELSNSSQPEDAVLGRQQGADRSKLIGLRRSLKKAATVSSFGQTLSEIGKQSQPSQHVLAPQHSPDVPSASRRSQGGQKYSPLHKNHKSSARDRRRKYMKKQTSLPSSLEPLLEEDENSKPGMVKSKHANATKEAPAGMQLLKPHSPGMGREAGLPCKLKIVMEQPSIESREAMSRQGTTDVDVDEAIADVDTDNTPKVTMEQYLVVQAIIDSKDSGFENGPSQNGSPQMSPRSSEDETAKSMDARMKTCPANSGPLRRTKSSDSDSAVDRLLSITSPNQTKSSNIPAPLSFSIKPFQTQINKKQNPKRNDLPMRSVQPNLESSNPDVPVSTDAEGSFSQTTVEGDDTFQGSPTSTGETVSCQTSPNLHSPLLSPLFFLESISEHPDGTLDTDCSLQVFVMPDGAEESLSKNAGRSDSLESVMPTGDGLAKGTSQENKSQEISDGGLSMIAEKEEPCHEPTGPVAETERHQKLLSPIIKTDGKKLEVASQHHFDELQHDSNTTENVESIKIPSHTTDKSRNPFKETKDFYASHHSDYDFDATIEEDEDGEQYSDGESFSKVTFSETPSMLSTFPVSSGSELKERNQDLETQDPCLCQVENDKENMQENAMTDEPVVTATDNIALQCEKSGAGEHNILEKEKDKVLSEASTIIHGNCIDVVTQHKQQNLETMPQGTEKSSSVTNSNKSERNDDRQDDYTRHSQGNHHSNPNTGIDAVEKQISSHIERHVKASDSDCSAAGNDFQIADKDKNIDEERLLSPTVKGSTLDEGLHLAESSEIQPDCPIVGEDTNNCIDSAATKLQNNPSVGFHKADVVKENFLAFVPGDKAEIPNPLPAVTNQLEEWNLGFDQRAIIRSISLEANMNHQKKKIRTLSERNTLYSDGMEPLLPGFGRVVTERSNASTEGFGSFGSDVFHRPLTVKQTLQQVASKLESLVRQRSLVSILDQEPEDDVKVRRRRTASLEESNREMLPTHSRKILTDFDPRDRRKKSLSRDKTKYSPLQEDEGYEEVNSIDESIVDSSGAEKNETNLSNIPPIKTAQIDSKLNSNKSLSHHNVSRETKTPTEEILTQNTKVHLKAHSIDQNGPSTVEIQTSITKPSPAAADKSKKRKNWQLQTSSGRRSSNFLTVPSFGSLNDSVDLISDNSSADREMRSVCNSTGGNGITPMIKQRLECENLHGKSKNFLVSSVSDDSVGSSIALNVGAEDLYKSPEDGCKCTVNNSNNDVESLTNSWSNTDLGCESVSVYVVENSSVPLKDVKTKDHPVMKSPQSVMSTSSEKKERTTQVYEQNASSESGSNNTISVLVNNNQNMHISSDEKPDETSNYVYIRLQPPNGMKRSIQGTVAHSQFVRCEKYLNVATSSNGKVDFIESDDASMSHQVPTFLSEVQFLPLSDSSKRSSFQISEDIPSQGSVSLDCPSPVSSSRLSPTFEEICNKAGHLMHRLQNALATRASPTVEMSSPIMENKCEEAFVIEEEDSVEAGDEEEEEGASGFGRFVKKSRYTCSQKSISFKCNTPGQFEI